MITYRVRQKRMFRYEAFHFLSDFPEHSHQRTEVVEIGRAVKRFLLSNVDQLIKSESFTRFSGTWSQYNRDQTLFISNAGSNTLESINTFNYKHNSNSIYLYEKYLFP